MTELLAADSWLVVDGRVRAVDRHWERFGAACREQGVEPAALAALRVRVEGAVPSEGRWFPCVELHEDGELAARWADGGPAAGDAPRAATWQRRLDAQIA